MKKLNWLLMVAAVLIPAAYEAQIQIQGNVKLGGNVSLGSGGVNITNLLPMAGPAGTPVTITGKNFGDTQGGSTVTFNGTSASPTGWNSTSIVTAVPDGATTGPVVVTVNGVASNGVVFTVTDQVPTITGVLPASGAVGTLVTTTGSYFGATQGSGLVVLGTLPGQVISWGDTQITALIAPGSATGIVQVTQAGTPSNSMPFTVGAPTITSVSPQNGGVGTQVTIDGVGFGAVRGSGQVFLGTIYGTVSSWSDTEIIATVAPGSMTGTVQVVSLGGASNSLPFTVAAPIINQDGVSPTNGVAGTQVTITGSGFGASQGSGNYSGKVMLGTAYGTVVSWSDTQVVATVASGSSTGVVQVWQGGVASNTETFTVTTPTITDVSPTSGGSGTQVTITGTGFGASQGSGQAWLGTDYATIVSWSDTQVVATVASDSGAGVAQVLQNGVWSNSVPFGSTAPHITSVTPGSGTANTTVTITGTGFGASQGSGIVWIGSTTGNPSQWSDTQIVATVDASAKTGSMRVEQAGVWSNAVPFVVPTFGSGNQITVVPNVVSLLVGETRTLQALDSNGAVVQGLTWTSSDPNVASLSTDDPPIITAVAAGHVSITAGDASADVTVYSGSSLPTGTVIWSAPGDGSTVQQILPAVPSPTGVADVFAVMSSGKVQAITADGSVAWTANMGGGGALPDFQGGFASIGYDEASGYLTVIRVDGKTGQRIFEHVIQSEDGIEDLAIHPDGTIFVNTPDSLIGLDGTTGNSKFTIQLEHWTYSGCEQADMLPAINQLIIAGDGYAYLSYEYAELDATCQQSGDTRTETDLWKDDFKMLRVAPNGDFQKIVLGEWTETDSFTSHIACENGTCYTDSWSASHAGTMPGGEVGVFSTLVTNANQGVAVAMNYELPGYWSSESSTGGNSGWVPQQSFNRLVVISDGSVVSDSNMSVRGDNQTFTPLLQAEDETYFGTESWTSDCPSHACMAAFDLSGNVKWTVPGFTPVMATADGGVTAKSLSSGQSVTFDQNGVANGMRPTLPTYSWVGNAYQDGLIDRVAVLPVLYTQSYMAMVGNNESANGTSILQALSPVPPSTSPQKQLPPPGATLNSNYNSIEILTTASPDTIFSKYIQTFVGAGNAGDPPQWTQNPNHEVTIINAPPPPITASGQNITFRLDYYLNYVGCSPPWVLPCPMQGPFSVQSERFDSTAHTISAVTLTGHPIAGWRYWKVYSVGPNDVVVETGAVDTAAKGLMYEGAYIFLGSVQLKTWEDDLRYILSQIKANDDHNAVEGNTPKYNIVRGEWNQSVPGSPSQSDILNNVCQSSTCN